jgi:penicillin V acylase-like amidase (Ntn superfamily)
MGLAIGATACYDPSMVDIKYTKAILKREPRDLAFPFLAIRESLDSAKNIEEAIKIFEKHDLYGSQMHFLVSDVSGRSVIIEYTDKGMLVYEGKPTQVMLTKPFYMYGDEANSKLEDNRNRGYNKALKTLPINNEEAMNVLKSGSQPKSSKGAYTQWSVVYNQITGEISCTVFMDYKNIHKYQLNMKKY